MEGYPTKAPRVRGQEKAGKVSQAFEIWTTVRSPTRLWLDDIAEKVIRRLLGHMLAPECDFLLLATASCTVSVYPPHITVNALAALLTYYQSESASIALTKHLTFTRGNHIPHAPLSLDWAPNWVGSNVPINRLSIEITY